MNDRLEIRDLSLDNIEEWADLLERVNAAEPNVVPWGPTVLHSRFTSDFAMKGPHSLAGAWLNGRLVGYARVRQDGQGESRLLRLAGAVDPQTRRQGIGTQLMRWSLATAREWSKILGPVTTIADAPFVDRDLQRILDQFNFQKATSFMEMERAISADNLPNDIEGLLLRPYSADLYSSIRSVHLDVHGPDSEGVLRGSIAKASFRPDLSRVALDPQTHAVLGYLLVGNSTVDSQAWIDSMAVRRRERGRQVTAALIVSALQGSFGAGLNSAGLGIELNDTVMQDMAVCKQLGFTTTLHWGRYLLPLDPPNEVKLSVRQVEHLTDYELHDVARWIAVRNRKRTFYVGYLGTTSKHVQAELMALSTGSMLAQLHYKGKRVGLMMAEWDPAPSSTRAWLHGPWAPHDQVADVLFAALTPYIPGDKNEWESFCDKENTIVTDFVTRHGLLPDREFDNNRFMRGNEIADPVSAVLPYEERYFKEFERLHYTAHPDTHLTAERIVAEEVPLNLAFYDGKVRGYITYKLSAGESIARVEHLATDVAMADNVRSQILTDLLNFALQKIFENPRIGQVEMVTLSGSGTGDVPFEVVRSMGVYRTVPRLIRTR